MFVVALVSICYNTPLHATPAVFVHTSHHHHHHHHHHCTSHTVVASRTAHDMRALENMEYLLCPVFRRAKGMARLKAGLQQMTGKKRAVRKVDWGV